MNRNGDAACQSYDACRRFSRRAGSNFYLSFLLLPRGKRRAMDALYAFMRHTDDLADSTQPTPLRAAALTAWRAEFEEALLGRFDNRPSALLPALADVVRRYEIPPDCLRAVIDGVEMDLRQDRYETFADLERYCELVASAVGVACIHIWGFRGVGALESARKCGIALQLTNILRDLRGDAEQGRVYLPLEDLRACGYAADDLARGVADERFARLMWLEIDRAEAFYRDGNALMDLLEPDGQRVHGMIMAVYRAILEKVKRRPSDVFRRRVCVSRFAKLRIAARWAFLPPRAAALP